MSERHGARPRATTPAKRRHGGLSHRLLDPVSCPMGHSPNLQGLRLLSVTTNVTKFVSCLK